MDWKKKWPRKWHTKYYCKTEKPSPPPPPWKYNGRSLTVYIQTYTFTISLVYASTHTYASTHSLHVFIITFFFCSKLCAWFLNCACGMQSSDRRKCHNRAGDKKPIVTYRAVDKKPIVTYRAGDKKPIVTYRAGDKKTIVTYRAGDKKPIVTYRAGDKKPIVPGSTSHSHMNDIVHRLVPLYVVSIRATPVWNSRYIWKYVVASRYIIRLNWYKFPYYDSQKSFYRITCVTDFSKYFYHSCDCLSINYIYM